MDRGKFISKLMGLFVCIVFFIPVILNCVDMSMLIRLPRYFEING